MEAEEAVAVVAEVEQALDLDGLALEAVLLLVVPAAAPAAPPAVAVLVDLVLAAVLLLVGVLGLAAVGFWPPPPSPP